MTKKGPRQGISYGYPIPKKNYKVFPYDHGLIQDKLNNLYLGEKEGWRLQNTQGEDLGTLTLAIISDMREGDAKIGPMTAMQHLSLEQDLQKSSFLQKHQWLSPENAAEDLRNPEEKRYTHVVAELNDGKKVKGVGFAVVDRDSFSKRGGYVEWFFLPTLRTKGEDFSYAKVVQGNGHKIPLHELIRNQSLKHIGGENLVSVYDASEGELKRIPEAFMALAPKLDVPKVDAKSIGDYRKKADKVHIVVGSAKHGSWFDYWSSKETWANRFDGIELEKAFDIYFGYFREAYFPQWANVRDGKKSELKAKNNAAISMYNQGIFELVSSAVKVRDKILVPWKDAEAGTPISREEKIRLVDKYKRLGAEAYKNYVRYPIEHKK